MNSENSAAASPVFHIDPTAMLFNDALANSQPQSRTFTNALGGKERLKDVVDLF